MKYPERQPRTEGHFMMCPIPERWVFMSPEEISAWQNEEMPGTQPTPHEESPLEKLGRKLAERREAALMEAIYAK